MSHYDEGPAYKYIVVSPNDADLPRDLRGFHVGGAGDVVITAPNGDIVTFKSCIAGAYYPYACKGIRAATTATDIIGIVE